MKVKAIGSTSVSLVWEIDGCREERFSRFKIYVEHKSYLACEDKTVKDKLRVQNIYPAGVLRRRLLHRNGNFVPLAP